METFVKIWFAQISLAAPKIRGGTGRGCCSPPAPTARTPMGAITFFFQLNNGVDPITWILKSSKGQMNIISQTISNFTSQYVTFDQKRKILWPKFYCLISLNPSETLVCWSVRASLVN